MKKTLVKIGGVLIITALTCAVTLAQEKPVSAIDSAAKAKKLEAMGAARARLQQAIQEVAKLTDGSASGYNVKIGEIQRSYDKTCLFLDQAIAKEQAKPATEQKPEQLKTMNNERQNVAQLWNKYLYIDRVAFDTKISEAYQRYITGLNPLFANLSAVDTGWTKLDLDMDQLKVVYELVEKSALVIKSQQLAALADMDVQVTAWRNNLINAVSRYNAWTGENEKVDK